MNLIGNNLPGYRLCDYMIILNPHEDLGRKITTVREEFSKEYKTILSPSRPNVLLATFKQVVMNESRIINRLNTIAMGHYPFKVELKDFGSFPSHTIYITITSKVPIQDLVKQIRSNSQALMKLDNDNKPYFSTEPHMTIAKKLKPWQYEKGWLEYSNKHFTGRFIADEMLLLKRYEGDKSWQVARRFQFQNLPVTVKQGDLFG